MNEPLLKVPVLDTSRRGRGVMQPGQTHCMTRQTSS